MNASLIENHNRTLAQAAAFETSAQKILHRLIPENGMSNIAANQDPLMWWVENEESVLNAVQDIFANQYYHTITIANAPKKNKVILAIQQVVNEEISKSIEKMIANLEEEYAINRRKKIDDDEDRPASFLKRAWFIFYASVLALIETINGVTGVFLLLQYFCPALPTAFMLITSLFFGFVNMTVSMAFDIKAIADEMNIPYLSASKELKALASQSKQLIELNKYLKQAFNSFNTQYPKDKTELNPLKLNVQKLQEILTITEQLHARFQRKVTEFDNAFRATYKKRLAFKITWLLLAAPLYAGSANMAALSFVALLPVLGCPPVLAAVSITVSVIWVLVELYRFYSFERQNMYAGVDALFGSPKSQFSEVIKNKEILQTKLERNKEINKQVTKKLEYCESSINCNSENARLRSLLFRPASNDSKPSSVNAAVNNRSPENIDDSMGVDDVYILGYN